MEEPAIPAQPAAAPLAMSAGVEPFAMGDYFTVEYVDGDTSYTLKYFLLDENDYDFAAVSVELATSEANWDGSIVLPRYSS
jgi:hypothetical protein